MKKIILILLLCSIIRLTVLSTNSTKPVLSNLLDNEGIDSYHIPAFLIKYVLRVSDEADEIQPLFNGARFINIAICDNDKKDYSVSYKRVCKGLDLSSYLNLVDIVDNKSKITIKALLSDDLIREFNPCLR